MTEIVTLPNPALLVGAHEQPGWNQPDRRRHGFHNLHRLSRYGRRFRAGRVLPLQKEMKLAIAERPDVAALTALPWFSGMILLQGQKILFERYARDFAPDCPHSIQSVSKMTINLIIGKLVETGAVDLGAKIQHYLPWIGPGYAAATVQETIDMNVNNDYSEDYSDPRSRTFIHECDIGYRLPAEGVAEGRMKSFLATIGLAPGVGDTQNRSGQAMYRSANTDVLAFVAEAASGRPIDSFLADFADAAGFEGNLDIGCDRDGFPSLNGGISLTLRDLARYGAIFARMGRGVAGEAFGSEAFLRQTLKGGVQMPAPRSWLRYSNMTNTDGRWVGHGGYGGQYMLIDLATGTVGAFLSVLENRDAYDSNYYPPIIRMLAEIAGQT